MQMRMMIAAGLMLAATAGSAVPQAPAPKLEFDVASIRQNKSGAPDAGGDPEFANVPMGPEDTFRKTGGVFTTRNTALVKFISFAYKVTTSQREVFRASLPEWVQNDRYNIEARTDKPDLTKDDLRMMMRALLAERIRLAVHQETREVSVYAVVLAKPGVLAPHLRAHPADAPCSTMAPSLAKPDPDGPPPAPKTVAGGYPATCGGFARMEPSQPWLRHEGARNMPMATTVTAFSGLGALGRPVIDRTGLAGNYDWVIELCRMRRAKKCSCRPMRRGLPSPTRCGMSWD